MNVFIEERKCIYRKKREERNKLDMEYDIMKYNFINWNKITTLKIQRKIF